MWVCSWKANILLLCAQKIMFMNLQNQRTDWIVVNPSNETAYNEASWGSNNWSQLKKNPTSQFPLCIYKVLDITESHCQWVKIQMIQVHCLLALMIVNKLTSLTLSFHTYKMTLIILPVTLHRCCEDGKHGQKQGTNSIPTHSYNQ